MKGRKGEREGEREKEKMGSRQIYKISVTVCFIKLGLYYLHFSEVCFSHLIIHHVNPLQSAPVDLTHSL